MRLNRVLLLAASFICMALAMVFTISCSGEDGKDGSLKSCTLQGSMSEAGLAVVCEGTTLGIIPPGPQGPAGQTGPQGPAGTLPPEYCKIGTQDAVTGKWSIICNGQQIGDDQITGQLDNCTTNDGNKANGIFIIKCPNNPEDIWLCGGVPYSPAENSCVPRKTSTDENQQTVYVTEPTWCGGAKFDSRTHFCDGATIRELCGGDKYKTSSPDNETCVNGNVTKPCIGTSTRYIKKTQFCMLSAVGNVGTVTARCGTANEYGVFTVGNANSGDLYNGRLLFGEYQTSKNELCEGGKVVMRCGTEMYEEKTHFCATGNVVTPHCDDRVQYNPTQRFCSYRANPDYAPNGPACKNDATHISCKEYASTAMVFCGGNATTDPVLNRYNVGSWIWEYCVPKKNPDASASSQRVLFSVLRCSANQVPDGVAAAETCRCIPNADRITGGNACACRNPQTNQYQALILKSVTSYNVASSGYALLTGYEIPGIASSGIQPSLKMSLPTNAADAAVNSLASGLPYNYTVGSGLDLNYAADKGFLFADGTTGYTQITGVTTAAGSSVGTLNGTPNNYYDIIPAFIGGSCRGTAPTCAGGTYTLCTQAECTNTAGSNNSSIATTVWDTPTSACVKDDSECTNKFGANSSRVCRDQQGDCVVGSSNLAKDQCTNYADCKAVGGYWDMYTLRNRCRDTAADCISGTANTGTVLSGDANLCDAR